MSSADERRTALRALWRRIPYGVLLPDGRHVDVFVGAAAPAVDDALGAACWAYVTAHNPQGRRAAPDVNARAQCGLVDELLRRGVRFLRGTGGRSTGAEDGWPPEDSVVVADLDLVDAHDLARRHGQAAFLYAVRGAPVALVDVVPAAFTAPRAIRTVAWVHVDSDDVRGARCLMVRPRGKSLFFMPGGKKEPGETDARALARELREELAVDVDPASIAALFVVEEQAFGPHAPTVVQMACYTARVRGTPQPSSEIEAIDGVALDEDHRVPSAGRAVLARLRGD